VGRPDFPLPLGPTLAGRIDRGDSTVTMALCGEFDLVGVPAVDARLKEIEADGPVALVVDLDRVQFLDSSLGNPHRGLLPGARRWAHARHP
jgi:hypothetical protein